MAYGLWLKLDQSRWFRGDFSASSPLTGTVYTDVQQLTAKSLTGYAIKVIIYRDYHYGALMEKVATIVSATAGTWSYAIKVGEIPPRGYYYVKVELAKSGDKESTLNKVRLHVLPGPSTE